MTAPAPEARRRSPLRAAAIVPARIGSTRLPRKMLLRETGRYLFEHTARNAEASGAFESVWVATDSDEVLDAAREVGVRALATSPDHASGTDRVLEAVRKLGESGELRDPDVVVGVQGDEPDLAAADLLRLVEAFEDEGVEAATLWAPIGSPDELADPSAVKVVCDRDGWALYFSRAPIPSDAHPETRAGADLGRRHLGIYAWRPRALERFCALERGVLEARESLEQLRWLENGGRMLTLRAEHVARGIDTRADYDAFVADEGTLRQTEESFTR